MQQRECSRGSSGTRSYGEAFLDAPSLGRWRALATPVMPGPYGDDRSISQPIVVGDGGLVDRAGAGGARRPGRAPHPDAAQGQHPMRSTRRRAPWRGLRWAAGSFSSRRRCCCGGATFPPRPTPANSRPLSPSPPPSAPTRPPPRTPRRHQRHRRPTQPRPHPRTTRPPRCGHRLRPPRPRHPPPGMPPRKRRRRGVSRSG